MSFAFCFVPFQGMSKNDMRAARIRSWKLHSRLSMDPRNHATGGIESCSFRGMPPISKTSS